MMTLDSTEFKGLIHTSQSLRGEGNFKEAIATVEASLGDMDEDCFENVYLEIIYAAQESGRSETAREYALRLQRIDPDIPTVKVILG
jgi:hypothetical protein